MIIKTRMNGAVAICTVASVVIAYANAPQFKQALEFAEQGLPDNDKGKPVDVVIYTPESYTDITATEVLMPEQIATTTREDVSGDPVAVLVTDDEWSIHGTHYQFIYAKDSVEILADNGQCLAVVNGQSTE